MKKTILSKLYLKVRGLTGICVLLFLCLVLASPSWAADWHVRAGCGTNGNGTGSACGSAWDAFSHIVWASIQPGDTLYVIGTFTDANLNIGKAGTSSGGNITIRGDHAAGAGQIGNAATGRKVCVNSYSTFSHLTVYGSFRVCFDFDSPMSTSVQFIAATNEIRDYDKKLIKNGFTTNDQFLCRGGTVLNTHVFGVASNPTDEGTYERMYVNTPADGAQWAMNDEGPRAADFYKFKKVANVIVDNCKVVGDGNYDPFSLGGVSNLTIANSEVDGNGLSTGGAYYINGNDSWRRPSNILIENNYIHDIGRTTYQAGDGDAHCIGLQAANGVIIRGNHLKNCAAGIVIYPGSSANQAVSGLEISRNLIEGMNYNRNPGQFGGSGIYFSGVDQCPLCTPALVAYNVITTPLNCPATKTTYECVGIGSKWAVKNKLHNNTMIANDVNFAFDIPGTAVDLRNNISLNPNLVHIVLSSPGTWTEDYNIYYPNTGTKFRFGGATYYNYADYIANHPAGISCTNCNITDPLVQSNHTLLAGSPAIDKGDNATWSGKPSIFDFTGSVGITNSSGSIIAPGGIVNIGAYEK